MRVFASYFEIERNYEYEYVRINLDKALGHVYRAGYDTLDWTALYKRKYISDEIAPFSLETINSIFPEYYKDMRPDLESINELIAKKRLEKDVGNPNIENFVEYVKIVEKIHSYYDEVLKKKSSLIEYENKLKKKERRNLIRMILVGIFLVIVSVIIGYFVGA